MQEQILKMFFEDGKKQIEIANILNISKYKVSRIVSNDPRYENEKEYRKIINKKKHIEKTKKYITKTRKIKAKKKKNVDDYAVLKALHNKASRELSGGRNSISNMAYKKWNSSAYRYDGKNKSYVLKEGLNVGADAPRRIRWTNN